MGSRPPGSITGAGRARMGAKRKKTDRTWEKNGKPGWRAEHNVVCVSLENRGNEDHAGTSSHDGLEMVR